MRSFFDRSKSKRRAPKGMRVPHEGKPKTHPCMNQTRKDGAPGTRRTKLGGGGAAVLADGFLYARSCVGQVLRVHDRRERYASVVGEKEGLGYGRDL